MDPASHVLGRLLGTYLVEPRNVVSILRPAPLQEGARTRLMAVWADGNVGKRSAESLHLTVQLGSDALFVFCGLRCHVGRAEPVAQIGVPKVPVQMHDRGPRDIDSRPPQHVELT